MTKAPPSATDDASTAEEVLAAIQAAFKAGYDAGRADGVEHGPSDPVSIGPVPNRETRLRDWLRRMTNR